MKFALNQEIFYNSRILNISKPNFCLDRICKIKLGGVVLELAASFLAFLKHLLQDEKGLDYK